MDKKWLIAVGAVFAVLAAAVIIKISGSARNAGPFSANPESVRALVLEAKRLETQGELLAIKTIYQKLVSEFPNSRDVLVWQKKIEDTNMKLLFSPVITAKTIEYVIKPGDSLERIAKEYKTTVELIKRSNSLDADNIFPGQTIKVWTAPFSVLIDKSQNTLILKADEELIKSYIVSTGTNNCTPVGTFRIIEKIMNPPWYKPTGGVVPAGSPENILGSRWMGLDKQGYGIHGTTEPQSMGKQATAGCVRMLNTDVEELYSILPQGTEVTIVD